MSSSSSDYTLFSDGGSSGAVAAGACIVDGHLSGKRLGALVYLGEATNNEAEISASLLGFSLLRIAAEKRGTATPLSIHWVSDSEYTLKSAKDYIHNWLRNGWRTASKDPVKNQGLWRAYLFLTKGFKISTQHVRGHTGHPENELCDEAANWAKDFGDDALHSGSTVIEIPGVALESWFLVDGRPFVEALRTGDESDENFRLLEVDLRKLVSKKKPASGKKSDSKASAAKSSAAAEKKLNGIVEAMRVHLGELQALAGDLPRADTLAAGLRKLLKSYD